MGPLVLAWIVGQGFSVTRYVKAHKGSSAPYQNEGPQIPPTPGSLVLTSGVFVLLAILGESEKARPLAVTLGWGFDIAAFINLLKYWEQGSLNAVLWPPTIAPNTVIIPNGKSGSATAGNSSGTSATTPVLINSNPSVTPPSTSSGTVNT